MVWYDFVILAILVYGVWQGAARGLVMQLAWIVAIVLCFKFADELAPQIESSISVEPPLRRWIAMFILYLGFSLGSFLVARSLSNAIEKAKLKDFDRHLGGLFGLVKGIILSLVLTFFAVTLSEPLQETVVRSKSGYAACWILDLIKPLTPEDARPLITDSLKKYQKALQQLHEEHQGVEASPDNILKDFLGGQNDHRNDNAASRLNDDVATLTGSSDRGPSYDTLLGVLPASMRDQMSLTSLRDQWNRLTADERDTWVADLKYATPAETPGLLEQLDRTFGGQGSGRGIRVDSRLVGRIAAEYADSDDPELIAVRIRQYLADVPKDVQDAVLEDWYADVILSRDDPDPGTDEHTRVDDRILRQLERARVSIDGLAYDLRTRLLRSR